MFSRKPSTALTAKKAMQRNHSREEDRKQATAFNPTLEPVNGFANINGFLMPF